MSAFTTDAPTLKADGVVEAASLTVESPVASPPVPPCTASQRMMAGSTLLQGIPMFDGITDDMIIPHSWSTCQYESFNLRIGPNYKKSKAKGPSPYPFYEPVGFDFVKCKRRIDNFASQVTFPEEWSEGMGPNNSGLPSFFVVNSQLPSEFSSPMFGEVTDGDGWSLVQYFRLSDVSYFYLPSVCLLLSWKTCCRCVVIWVL